MDTVSLITFVKDWLAQAISWLRNTQQTPVWPMLAVSFIPCRPRQLQHVSIEAKLAVPTAHIHTCLTHSVAFARHILSSDITQRDLKKSIRNTITAFFQHNCFKSANCLLRLQVVVQNSSGSRGHTCWKCCGARAVRWTLNPTLSTLH